MFQMADYMSSGFSFFDRYEGMYVYVLVWNADEILMLVLRTFFFLSHFILLDYSNVLTTFAD